MEKKKDKDERGVWDAPSSSKRITPVLNIEIPDAADKEEMKQAKKSWFGQKEERERRGIKIADIDEDQINILQGWSTTAKRAGGPLTKPNKENESFHVKMQEKQEGESSARVRPELQAIDNAGKGKEKSPIRKKKKESFEIKMWALEEDPVKQEGESSGQNWPEIQAIDNARKGKEKFKLPIRKKKRESFEIKKRLEEDPVKHEGECSARIRPELPAIVNAGNRKKKEKESLEMKQQQVEGGDPVKQEGGVKGKEKVAAENQDSDKQKPETTNTTPPSPQHKYKCIKCGKTFPTHQALGGHCSSHNKTRLTIINTNGRFGPIINTSSSKKKNNNNKKTKMKMSGISVNIDLNKAPQEEDVGGGEAPSTANQTRDIINKSSNISVSIDLNMMPPKMEDDDDS